MFSGIVQEIGLVKTRQLNRGLLTFTVQGQKISRRSAVGSSVLISGVCTTVIKKTGSIFTVSYVPETQKKTTVASWQPGQRLNLEPSLRLGDEISGHFVFGHVDGRGAVKRFTKRDGAELIITAPLAVMKFLAPKGSICLDGVSLTIVTVAPNQFSVALIPHTLRATTLSKLKPGSQVNIEVDMLMRYVGESLNRSQISKLSKSSKISKVSLPT